MKKINLFKLTVLISILIPFSVKSQFTETREFIRRFGVNPETQIEISNKYGKIDLNTWEKDSVIIKINIKIEERKLSKLEQTLDDIDFDFTSGDHLLIVRTKVETGGGPLENEIRKLKETVLQGDASIEINFSIWLPDRNRLKVENKFGDIFIDDYSGETDIFLSNGNLKAHDLTGKTNLFLNFSNASINSVSQGNIETNYSEIDLRSAESLRITSKSTTWEIVEVKDLYTDSRRDKFRIRQLSNIEGKGNFTSFRINELTNKLNVRTEYGDVEVGRINSNFNSIFMEAKSSDINLYFNPNSGFGFDITLTKTEFDLCHEMKTESQEVINEKDKKTRIRGYFGKKPESKEKLFINTLAGELNIYAE